MREHARPDTRLAPGPENAPTAIAGAERPDLDPRARRADIRRAFDRAAHHYDAAAHVQREICTRLGNFAMSQDLQAALRPGAPVLDAGCGTGFGFAELDRLCPDAPRIALDLAPAMLAQARRRHCGLIEMQDPATADVSQATAGRSVCNDPTGLHAVCGDLEHLPFADDRLGLIWSSLAIQWCDPGRALAECARVLAPGGIALIATLGPRTLWELREAFAPIDGARHTIDFHPATRWIEAARASALVPLAHEGAEVHACAPDLRGLLQDIKRIGAATVDGGRRRRPLGRAAWSRLQAHYERHRRPDGRLPATYDLILLALRKPDDPDRLR